MGGLANSSLRRAAGVVALAALAGFATLMAAPTQPADAAFPGANGRIAYSVEGSSSASIWTANPDGGSAVRLTSGIWDRSPSFSPNGTRIAFERDRGIVVMNADGSGQGLLVDGDTSKSSETSWEENYEAKQGPPRTIPFVKVEKITNEGHSFDAPAFSPDGSQLAVSEVSEKYAFTVTCAVEEDEDEECIEEGDPDAYLETHLACLICTARIVAISSTSGARIGDLTTPPEATFDMQPAYSSSGVLAFRREGGFGTSNIFVVDSPGAAPRQVTVGGSDRRPDFSPDGLKIAFGQGGEIGIVDVAGGLVTVLPVPDPPGAQGFAGSPAFSPDGTRIAFERSVFPQGASGEGLYTIGVDGTGLSPFSSDGLSPSWGPLVPPPPIPLRAARATRRKGKVRLNRKGRARIATIACGSSACTLKVLIAKLKAGKKKCFVGSRLAKKLAPEKRAPLGIRVAGKCLAALRKAGKGKLVTKVQVVDALGKQILTFKSTVVPAGSAKPRKGKKG